MPHTAAGEHDLRRLLAVGVELSPAEVTDRIARDQSDRWKRGERVLVETYIGLHPSLADDTSLSDLIYSEVLLRETHGERPVADEYCFRFPEQADAIRSLFQVHHAFSHVPEPPTPAENGLAEPPEGLSNVRVPGFIVLQEIGRGGMGVVYKARQLGLDRIVAIKMLRPDEDDPGWEARLRGEAVAVGQLQHPHIVQVFNVGTTDGHPYLVLEYVPGGTLADRLKDGPLSPRQAAILIRTAALAVHAAHQHQIVHRDLKPGNILLSSADGRESLSDPKVVDFGLAKRLDQADLSQTGELVGTPHYMAPEQASGGKKFGPAADVYSLGAILYECLTGRPPFTGDNPLLVLMQAASSDPVQPSRLRTGLPRDLESVCLKCLEKNPARRYASALALAEDLGRFLDGRPTVARPLGIVHRTIKLVRRFPIAALLACLFLVSLIVGMAGVLWQWREAVAARGDEATQRRTVERSLYYGRLTQAVLLWESGDTARARELVAECRPDLGRDDLRGWEWHYLNNAFRPETRVERFDHWVNGLALLPAEDSDSPKRLAVAVGRPRNTMAYDPPTPDSGLTGFLELTTAMSGSFLSGPKLLGGATAVAVHPHGASLAWGVNNGQVVLSDAAGRELKTVMLRDVVTDLVYHPNGQTLYAAVANESTGCLYAIEPSSGKILATFDGRTVGKIAIDPSGGLLAYGGNLSRIYLLQPDVLMQTGELNGTRQTITSMTFTADGARLALGCDDGTLRLWDCSARTELRHWPAHTGSVYGLSRGENGRLLASGGADRTIRLWDPDSGRLLHTLRGHEASVRCIQFLPGGLVSGAQDGTVRFWDTNRDYRGRRLPFNSRLNGLAVGNGPDGEWVRAVTLAGLVQQWSLTDGLEIGQSQADITGRVSYPVPYTGFLDGGRLLVGISRADPGSVATFDAATGEKKESWRRGSGPVICLATDPTSRFAAWAHGAGPYSDVYWHDSKTNATSGPARFEGPVRGLGIAPDGSRIAAVVGVGKPPAQQFTSWVFDCASPPSPRKILRGESMLGGLAFHPDGSQFALAFGGYVQVYRTDTWSPLYRIGSVVRVTSLAYSPDGRRLAAVGYDGIVTLIDTQTGDRAFQLRGLATNRPNDMACDARVAFSPDGQWLVSTNWDGSLNLWDGRPSPH